MKIRLKCTMSCVKVKKQAVFEVKLKQKGVPAMCREKSSRVSMLKEKLHTASHTRKVCVVKLLKTKHVMSTATPTVNFT